MRLLHEGLTYEIRACIFDVHSKLKPGLDEESYHLALEKRLEKSNISFLSKPRYSLEHRGIKVHTFEPDFIVENKVILELKSIRTDFISANHVQIISYLKHCQKDLGLLVNFGRVSAKIERVPFFERELVVKENYLAIEDFILSSDGKYFKNIRQAILNVSEMYGLGYNYSIYKSLFQVELSYLNIPFSPSTLIPIKFDGEHLRDFELTIPIIDNRIICGITAGQSDLKIHKTAMKSYLKKTGVPIGIIANFSKDKLEIIGISY